VRTIIRLVANYAVSFIILALVFTVGHLSRLMFRTSDIDTNDTPDKEPHNDEEDHQDHQDHQDNEEAIKQAEDNQASTTGWREDNLQEPQATKVPKASFSIEGEGSYDSARACWASEYPF
jgi:hypothetical protein